MEYLIQCFTMFRIRSVVKNATTASSLARAVITRDRKASREDVAGRRGRKSWPKKRGRKAWPEGVVGKLALGFESLYLNPAVP